MLDLSGGIFLSHAHVRPPLSGARRPLGPSLANLTQKLFGRYKKRIVLKYASDDDHGMRPHDVNHRFSSTFREIVGADHGIVVAAPYIIDTRFELNQVIHVRPAVSAAHSMWQTMRLSGNPPLTLPLANCSKNSSA